MQLKLRAAGAGDHFVVTNDRLRHEAEWRLGEWRAVVVGNRTTGSVAALPAVSEPRSGHWTDIEGNTVVPSAETGVYRLHLAGGGVRDLVP